MDQTDRKILKIMQQNSRITITELGRLVSLTPPAVTERLRRLEDSGVIEGYHAILNPEKMGKNLTAFIHVQIMPEKFNAFMTFADANPLIFECYHIVGRNCILIKVMMGSTTELGELLDQIKKFGTTETSVVLNTRFRNKPFI